MALGRAADFLKAYPGGNVLIIAVELPVAHFPAQGYFPGQPDLFHSVWRWRRGCARQRERRRSAPEILVSETYTFPDSLGAMGFDLRDSGFHILLAKDVPEMIGAKIKGLVHGFLERHG